MHELSIAMSILEAAQRELALHKGADLRKISVRVGELAGVNPEALRFSFDAITRETAWEGVELELDCIARTNRCMDCGTQFVVNNAELACPECGSINTSFLRGDELEIASLEVEEVQV
jgi:hydrogenase nickel incorporation protein HypA/HybF